MKNILKFFSIIILSTILCGCGSVKIDENSIIEFDDGSISANDFYEVLKENYASEQIVDLIDYYLLNKKYDTSTNETKYINDAVDSAKSQAESYSIDFDSYVKSFYRVNGLKGFKKYISLNYKRSLWISDYAKEVVTDKQINDYYENETTGDMDLYHILITIKDENENDALNKAKEVISKLDNNESFESLAKEYSEDDATKNNGGSLGKINTNDYEDEVIDEAKKLDINSYTKTPVKTKYGYHIIYKKAQDDKPTLESVKTEIIETIASEIANEDGFYAKALIALRENNNMKFIDSNLEDIYNDAIGN